MKAWWNEPISCSAAVSEDVGSCPKMGYSRYTPKLCYFHWKMMTSSVWLVTQFPTAATTFIIQLDLFTSAVSPIAIPIRKTKQDQVPARFEHI
jgi:hypothetical protein